jgi:hypothetical protein
MAVLEDLNWRLGEAWPYIHSSSTPLQISIKKCETKKFKNITGAFVSVTLDMR